MKANNSPRRLWEVTHMLKSMIFGVIAAVACVGVASADPVVQVTDGERAIPVRYADLNLSSNEDARAMLSRLRYAAYSVCDPNQIERQAPEYRRQERACRNAALEDALLRLDAREVTAMHQRR
jgi:UrcA family protein